MKQTAWLMMAEAMKAVRNAGKQPEEAAAILFRALGDGTLLGRAKFLRTVYTDGATEHRNCVVPAGILDLGPMPPLGHPFWTKGDIRVTPAPLPDGSVVHIAGQSIPLPLGGLLPVYTIRGLRVPRDGLLAICRSMGGSQRVGRQKGTGGFAKLDEPLIQEMHRLIADGSATSAHAAAVIVAPHAKGISVEASKVRRLTERYKKTFPGPH